MKHYTLAEYDIKGSDIAKIREEVDLEAKSPSTSPVKQPSEKEMAGVGMIIQNQSPYRVVQISPGGPVDKSGKVAVGDTLLRVNGRAIDEKPITVIMILQSAACFPSEADPLFLNRRFIA